MVSAVEIQRLAEEIAHLAGAQRVILFGSHATMSAGEHSDVDLLIITDFTGRSRDLRTRLLRETGFRFPLDLVIQSPADVMRRYNEFDPLIRSALDHGKLLYERKHQGVA